MYNIGDRIDVREIFAIYKEAIVESMFTKKNGSLYLKVRGILTDGSLSKKQHNVWIGEINQERR